MARLKRHIPIFVVAIVLLLATSIYTLFRLDQATQALGAVSAASVHSSEALADLHSDFNEISRANYFLLGSNDPDTRAMLEHCVDRLDAHFDAELSDFDNYIAPSATMHRRMSAMRVAIIRFRHARDVFLKALRAGAVQEARQDLLPGGALHAASQGVQGSLLTLREENSHPQNADAFRDYH